MPGDGQSHDFPSTRWSRVGQAGHWSTDEGKKALDELLRDYRPALEVHLRLRFGMRQADGEEMVQAFVAHKILEQQLLSAAQPQRGRFRNLLRTALDNFVISELRRRRPVNESDRDSAIGLDQLAGSASDADPFTHEWAVTVVRRAVARFEAECLKNNRADLWRVFEARVLNPTLRGQDRKPHDELARELQVEGAAKTSNLLVTIKRQFSRILHETVSEYAGGEQEVREEILDLRKYLAQGARVQPRGRNR